MSLVKYDTGSWWSFLFNFIPVSRAQISSALLVENRNLCVSQAVKYFCELLVLRVSNVLPLILSRIVTGLESKNGAIVHVTRMNNKYFVRGIR